MTTADPPVGAGAVGASTETVQPTAPEPVAEVAAPTTEPDSVKPGLRIGVALVLIVAAILLYISAPRGIVQEALPLFLAATVATFAPLFISRKFDPFTPACYHALVNGVVMVSLLASFFSTEEIAFGGMQRLGYDERVDLLNKVSLAYIVQATAYCVGYYFTGGASGLLKVLPKFQGFQWNSRRLWFISGALWLIFLVAYARFQSVAQTGIFDVASAETKAVWRNEDDRMAWLFRALQLGAIPIYALTARFISRSSNDSARPKWMFILLLLTAALALLGARIGQRGYSIVFLIALAAIVHYVWRRIPTPVILGAAFVAIIATNYLGAARTKDADVSTVRVSTAVSRPAEVLARLEADRSHLAATGCAMYYFPERHDYLKGSSYLSILLFPIPRAIWPEKAALFPMSENGIVWQILKVPVPMPYPFVFYANFGWVGMFICMALWGAFHKTLFKWVHQSGYQPGVVAIYATLLVTFIPTTSGVASLLGGALPLFILMKLMKRA